ncbi:MAG: 4'-phosphopantetheinyl transferase superfamily protein [Aeromonadaceae bacterium]|nr:4'-phosphopantetheinyl transferase superfamily protein [Aeromonadaceae bacterium]
MLLLYRWSVLHPLPSVCLHWLEAAELARFARLGSARLANSYAHAHLGLRCLLAQMRGEHPAALRFVLGRHGKPALSDGPHFSLSHAGGDALLAISTQAPVGVDLEAVDPHLPMDWLPPLLSAQERAQQQSLGAAWSPWRFWVRKEAWLKALGHGLAGDWGSSPVFCQPDLGSYRLAQEGGWVRDLSLPAPWIGALAWPVDRPLPPLRCQDLDLSLLIQNFIASENDYQ